VSLFIDWYDAHAAELVSRYEALDPARLNQWLLDLIPQTPGTVLDIGAGTGRDAAWFARHGHDVIAVEPSNKGGWSAREKTLAYEWFRILESSRLGGRTKSDDMSAIVDWRSWTIGFIATVGIESDRQIEIRVDAFPLFYELLNAFGDLFAKREFDIEVGEGWSFQGAPADGGFFELNICFGNDRRIFVSKRIRDRDVVLFLILKTSELASSLEKIDVDLEYFFTKFPIGIYRRGID
jgi:SAM-dependent methyltransferase